MKLASTAIFAGVSIPFATAAYNWQAVGFCGIPATSFDESVITSAQTRSGKGQNSVISHASSGEKKRQACENRAIKEYTDRENEKNKDLFKGRGLSLDDNEVLPDFEYVKIFDRLNVACNDNTDKGYHKKRLDLIGDLNDRYLELNTKVITAVESNLNKETRTTNKTMDAIYRSDVTEFLNDIEIQHKRCYKAYTRLSEQAEAKQVEKTPYKQAHPDNAVEIKMKAKEECDDTIKVVGGQDAEAHAWPWQIYISICGSFYGMMECNVCGGSLISNKWIVTAAHCVPSRPRGRIHVGAHDLNEKTYQTYNLGAMVKHPRWNYPGRFENDIALTSPSNNELIHIDFKMSSPICLPHKDNCFSDDVTCVVTGWGLTSERGQLANTLQVVGVKLMNREQCKTYTGYDKIAKSMICAGFKQGGYDACSGDSGGPLVCRMSSGFAKGAWVLQGVVSWGYGCARPGSPGVYTDVKQYLPWIEQLTHLVPDDILKIENESNNDGAEVKSCMEDVNYKVKNDFFERPKEISAEIVESEEIDHATCNYNLISGVWSTFEYKKNTTGSYKIFKNGAPLNQKTDDAIIGTTHQILFEKTGTIPATNCAWTWQNTDNEKYLEVDLKPFLMSNCQRWEDKDRLKMLVQYKDGLGQIQKITPCATRSPIRIVSKSFIQISFITKHREFPPQGKLGFAINWRLKDDTWHCSGAREFTFLSKEDQFQIKSPNFPKYYNSQQECRWEIQSNFDLRIHVKQFNTERQRTCNKANDNLIFYLADDCSSDTLYNVERHRIYGVLCGSYKNKFYRISTDQAFSTSDLHIADKKLKLCIVFLGDNDTKNGKGFDIAISVADPLPSAVAATQAPAQTTSRDPREVHQSNIKTRPPRKKKRKRCKGRTKAEREECRRKKG